VGRIDRIHNLFTTINNATGTVVHNCNLGHRFHHSSISADFTANFTNLNLFSGYSTKIELLLIQGPSAYVPIAVQIEGAGQTLRWEGGSPPSGTVNGRDLVTFDISNTGGTYEVLGSVISYT
jgi:hypothetical protein